ncbi:glycosyltransferase family 2 protein [Halanaerobaculum tunisiense]
MNTSLIIPVYNEEVTIKNIVSESKKYVDEIIVVDDGSNDDTFQKLMQIKNENINVIAHKKNKGYIKSIFTGVKKATGEIIITMDADGQHDVSEIPKLTKPIIDNQVDLVLGVRECLPRLGEKIMAKFIGLNDVTTGFKAFKKTFIPFLCEDEFYGVEAILKAKKNGLIIKEICVEVQERKEGESSLSNFKVLMKSIIFVIKSIL